MYYFVFFSVSLETYILYIHITYICISLAKVKITASIFFPFELISFIPSFLSVLTTVSLPFHHKRLSLVLPAALR